MKKRVLYGSADYVEVVREHGYFVDKTRYIEMLERVSNPVFLRPRRFGKSLWCRMLECYYNIKQQADFDRLFGHTYIGQHPTPLRNAFLVLHLDFSIVESHGTIEKIEASFQDICNNKLQTLVIKHTARFPQPITIDFNRPVSVNLDRVLNTIEAYNLPPVYVIIDEYDNFANQLIVHHHDDLYRALTADNSFLKTFFKTLKDGRKNGTIANVFITGVLPITIDDLASGFNIATMLTLDREFENMLGFTQTEVDSLLTEVYRDYAIDPSSRPEVQALLKNQYNGYHFITTQGEPLYNSTLIMYFLQAFTRYKTIPDYLIDANLKTDLSWVKRITGAHPGSTEEFVDRLLLENRIEYDQRFLVAKFNMAQFFEKDFFPISFYYLGMLTKHDEFALKLPNLNMREIVVEYFNELHHLDVSTKYEDMMRRFATQPDLPRLFADYWERYVSQLPEAIFQQVNENFYRTTFMELCSRYLSKWFTWNVERSYPQGRTDLEFVGKFHEQFAGLRYVIEFKYYSHLEFKKFHTTLDAFTVQAEDTAQIAGYVEGLRQEYPEARIRQFVIYCVGNQGFRVFEV